MKTATQQLTELAEFLSPTGVIGDGTVAYFHELAARARVEQNLSPTIGVLDLGSVVLPIHEHADGSVSFG